MSCFFFFFFSSRRRHTRFDCDWSSDVCSSDLQEQDWTHYVRIAAWGLHSKDATDRKSTRLNSSHSQISYAVFCLKKKKNTNNHIPQKKLTRPDVSGYRIQQSLTSDLVPRSNTL